MMSSARLAGLLLEPGDLGAEIAVDQGGVLPLGAFQVVETTTLGMAFLKASRFAWRTVLDAAAQAR